MNLRIAHLWVLLDGSRGLIPNAGLVHLRGDHLRQVKRIVDPSGRKALDLLRFTAILAGALR